MPYKKVSCQTALCRKIFLNKSRSPAQPMVCSTSSRRWYRQPDTGFELFVTCNYCPTTANAVIPCKVIVAIYIVLCHQMQTHLIDDFVIFKLKLFRQHTGSAGSFFTLKQYNQNHRLSRWYAPRLQGDGTGSPTRALNEFASRNYFSSYR